MAKRWACWLLWCVLTGMLYFFENNSATRILAVCSLALPWFDLLAVSAAARRLRLDVDVPDQAEKSEAIPLVIRIHHAAAPVRFRAQIQSENSLTGEAAQHIAWVPRSGIGQSACRCAMRSEHCGMLTVRLTLTLCGCLGLYELPLAGEKHAAVWVPPALRPIQVAPQEGEALQEDCAAGVSRPPRSAGDSFSIRAYMPGDPVRLIHWKLYEKLGMPMVRDTRAPLSDRLLLALDLSAVSAASDVSDMTEALFSLSQALLDSGMPHGIVWLPAPSVQPELRPIETAADLAAFKSDYFSFTPHRSLPLVPGEEILPFSRVVWFGKAPSSSALPLLSERQITPVDKAAGLHALFIS